MTLTEFAAAIKDLSDHSLSAGCKFTVSNRKTFQLCICWVQRVERTKWEDGRKVGNLQFCHYLGKVDPRQPAHHSQWSMSKPVGNREAMGEVADIWSNFPSSQICNFLIVSTTVKRRMFQHTLPSSSLYSSS